MMDQVLKCVLSHKESIKEALRASRNSLFSKKQMFVANVDAFYWPLPYGPHNQIV